jgi:hypothetical protein
MTPAPVIAPTEPIAILPDLARAPLVLSSSYSLDLDIVAANPVSTRRVRSRGPSASLLDRIYFAVRALRGRSGPRPSAPARRMPRKIQVAWGGRHGLV